jgi:hypothetical protein
MDRRLNWSLVALSLLVVTGCGQPETPTTTASAPAFSDPAAQTAFEFLDAVLKGDTQRASSQLTPTARQKIAESGKRFAPPGLETATLRMGEVRKPAENHAIVQGFLTDKQPDGTERSEEIGCILKSIGGQWLVSGLAYVPGPNRQFVVLDFENPQQPAATPQAQPPLVQSQQGQSPAFGTAQAPSFGGTQQQSYQTPQTPNYEATQSPQTAQQIEPAAAYR